MRKHRFLEQLLLILVLFSLVLGGLPLGLQAQEQDATIVQRYAEKAAAIKEKQDKRITSAEREAAAARAAESGFVLEEIGTADMAMPGDAPRYFSHPNYANSPLPGNIVAEWNAIAQQFLQPAGMTMTMNGISMSAAFVYLAYVQAAVYDALVAIEGGYQPYYTAIPQDLSASREAAVATAAYDVLKHYFPDAPTLDAQYADTMGTLLDSPAKAAGVAIGQAAADGIIALRAGDVLTGTGGYVAPPPGPGVWEPTATLPDGVTPMPPMDPWMAQLQPFLRATPDLYTAAIPAPPDLSDPEYASNDPEYLADFAEVRDYGGAVSAVRTPEQTEVARFWTTNMVIQTNAAYRSLAESRGLNLLDTARLMAMGNMIATDSLIATFNLKYLWSFWRPVTAIQHTNLDGTYSDVIVNGWQPVVMTPNFPEYVAGHGSFISAQAELYTQFLGTPQIEIDLQSGVTNTTRHYAFADDLRTEIVNARTWGGMHFRSSTELSVTIGQQLVTDALATHFAAAPATAAGNALAERMYASDFRVAVGELAPVFVVLPNPLPAGELVAFQTWNQARAINGFAVYLPLVVRGFTSTAQDTSGTAAISAVSGSAGNVFHAYVLRPTGVPNQYTVILDSGLLTVPPLTTPGISELAVYPVTPFPVLDGDVVAFYGQGIPVDVNGGTDIVSDPALTAPVVAETFTLGGTAFPILEQDRTYSFSAAVDTSGPHVAITGGIRKFVDGLPGLTAANANNLGQYLPVAVPDTTTYPDADYYEIAVVQYRERMHSDLPPTLLRGYVQLSTDVVAGDHVPLTNALLDGTEVNIPGFFGVTPPHYLGPTIVATKDRPVRIKFYNLLPTGIPGDLFLPVDVTVMGAGMGPDLYPMVEDDPQNPMCDMAYDMVTMERIPKMEGCYTDNRATLHLHGGISPWISDGTPHQWITPAGETTLYPQGVSVRAVPDMTDSGVPDDGIMTFYYTNQQSARLMFYHDHSWGITRLNVYGGGAAPYIITDDTEQALLTGGLIPGADSTIPLVVQDKTFVPSELQLAVSDETWDTVRWGGLGNLWLPHVYSPAQNPGDSSGVNQFGRWAYGPWFWPPTLSIDYGPVANPYYDPACDPDVQWCEPPLMPGTPYNSMGMEAFMDTPVINGTAYPTLTVDPKAYRFRILNAANDRFFNLSFYKAVDANGVLCDPNNLVPAPSLSGVTCTEVALNPDEVAAALDDPTIFPTPLAGTEGPDWIQIASEGGFLPAPAVIPAQPTTWVNDPTVFNAGNVDLHSLLLGPAERHDVIVDFSAFAGQTLILYNDAPAAFPARDPRYDYYTGDGDYRDTGGTPPTLPGYGPNTRTMMQIKVAAVPVAPAFDLAALQTAFQATSLGGLGVFENGQHPIVVGQGAYNSAYGTSFQNNGPLAGLVQIFDTQLTFKTLLDATLTMPLRPKQIQDEMGEAFDPAYGRMSGFLGLETPNAQAGIQNMILYPYSMPPTEILRGLELPPGVELTPIASVDDGSQMWKITHNGVDTHPIHVHLYDVQLINRVGWDGIIRKPEANELGWKDTVRVSPLEDTIVAFRPLVPSLPWDLPNSVRLIDPSMPEGVVLTDIGLPIFDPSGEPVEIINHYINFGWEYVWHCHILSHEEMDMMRPQALVVAPRAPSDLAFVVTGAGAGQQVDLTWVDNSINETHFTVQRATTIEGPWETLAILPADTTTYSDPVGNVGGTYIYRVFTSNTVGDTTVYPAPSIGFPTETKDSEFSNTVEATLP